MAFKEPIMSTSELSSKLIYGHKTFNLHNPKTYRISLAKKSKNRSNKFQETFKKGIV